MTKKAVIFDLGDVLFTWSPPTASAGPAAGTTSSTDSEFISPSTLREVLKSPIWHAYERGEHSEEEAYAQVGAAFDVRASSVKATIEASRTTLKPNAQMLDLIRALRNPVNGQRQPSRAVRVYAMSNISHADWAVLRTKASEEDWALFDAVFISAEAGGRKPERAFYEYVVRETGLTVGESVFVDDRAENVQGAEEAGLRGLVFKTADGVSAGLKELGYISQSES